MNDDNLTGDPLDQRDVGVGFVLELVSVGGDVRRREEERLIRGRADVLRPLLARGRRGEHHDQCGSGK